MNIEYKKDIYNSYMMIQSTEEIQQDSYEERMLLNNTIPSVIPFQYRWIDGVEWYCYDITQCKLFKEEYSSLGHEQIYELIKNILRVVSALEEYLLCSENLLLNLEHIYFNETNKDVCFAYVPNYKIPLFFQIRELITEVMNIYMDNKDPKAIVFVYSLYKLSCEENCTLTKVQDLMDTCMEEKKERANSDNVKEIRTHPPERPLDTKEEKKMERLDSESKLQKLLGKNFERLLILDGFLLCVGFLFFRPELKKIISWIIQGVSQFMSVDGDGNKERFLIAAIAILVFITVVKIGRQCISNKNSIKKWLTGHKNS